MPLVPPPHVLAHFPKAQKSSTYIRSFLWFARHVLGKNENDVALLLSICSDDLNNVQIPDTDMVGPFMLGGLDGYPFVGRTGLGAFSHHIPQNGVALMFYGPHVGITNSGDVGSVIRPGQADKSSCCGAASSALRDLESHSISKKPIEMFDLDDFQQESIRQWVLEHENEIIGAGPQGSPARFLTLTEVIYDLSHESMLRHLSKVELHFPAFIFGGILINEDGLNESDIEFRDLAFVHHGKIESMSDQFIEVTKSRFEALKAGDKDAFR